MDPQCQEGRVIPDSKIKTGSGQILEGRAGVQRAYVPGDDRDAQPTGTTCGVTGKGTSALVGAPAAPRLSETAEDQGPKVSPGSPATRPRSQSMLGPIGRKPGMRRMSLSTVHRQQEEEVWKEEKEEKEENKEGEEEKEMMEWRTWTVLGD